MDLGFGALLLFIGQHGLWAVVAVIVILLVLTLHRLGSLEVRFADHENMCKRDREEMRERLGRIEESMQKLTRVMYEIRGQLGVKGGSNEEDV